MTFPSYSFSIEAHAYGNALVPVSIDAEPNADALICPDVSVVDIGSTFDSCPQRKVQGCVKLIDLRVPFDFTGREAAFDLLGAHGLDVNKLVPQLQSMIADAANDN